MPARPASRAGVALGLPRLVAQFGVALLDKAVADAALRAAGLAWIEGVQRGRARRPVAAPASTLQRADSVALRHTVGLADRLDRRRPRPRSAGRPARHAARPRSRAYGLRYFKLKLCGRRRRATSSACARIAALLDARAGDYRVTLDGNETFADAAALGALLAARCARDRALRTCCCAHAAARAAARRARVALREPIAALGIDVPVILDESDDHAEAFDAGPGARLPRHLEQGLQGHLPLAAQRRARGARRRSACCCRAKTSPARPAWRCSRTRCSPPAWASRTSSATATTTSTASASRPTPKREAFAQAHPGLYDDRRRPRRASRCATAGSTCARLHVPGFASAAMPRWDTLTAIH